MIGVGKCLMDGLIYSVGPAMSAERIWEWDSVFIDTLVLSDDLVYWFVYFCVSSFSMSISKSKYVLASSRWRHGFEIRRDVKFISGRLDIFTLTPWVWESARRQTYIRSTWRRLPKKLHRRFQSIRFRFQETRRRPFPWSPRKRSSKAFFHTRARDYESYYESLRRYIRLSVRIHAERLTNSS